MPAWPSEKNTTPLLTARKPCLRHPDIRQI